MFVLTHTAETYRFIFFVVEPAELNVIIIHFFFKSMFYFFRPFLLSITQDIRKIVWRIVWIVVPLIH